MFCDLQKPKEKPKVTIKKEVNENGDLLDIEIHGLVGFTAAQKAFFLKAMELKKMVDNSQNYKLKILDSYMTQKQGRSNLEVYEHWRSGISNYQEVVDHDIDLFVTLYDSRNKSTLGYTSMSTGKIYTNRAVFNHYMRGFNGEFTIPMCGLVGHISHEYLHSVGYIHSGFWSYKRNAVPYVFGRVARRLAEEVVEGKQLSPLS